MSTREETVTIEVSTSNNEVQRYLDARFISASEACWRLFEFGLHSQKPAVVQLQVHLPDQQSVFFNPRHNPQDVQVVAQQMDTILTAFFKANQHYPHLARDLLYQDFPQKFTWQPLRKEWTPRQMGFAIGRMYYVPPAAGERFYLRLLLTAT